MRPQWLRLPVHGIVHLPIQGNVAMAEGWLRLPVHGIVHLPIQGNVAMAEGWLRLPVHGIIHLPIQGNVAVIAHHPRLAAIFSALHAPRERPALHGSPPSHAESAHP